MTSRKFQDALFLVGWCMLQVLLIVLWVILWAMIGIIEGGRKLWTLLKG